MLNFIAKIEQAGEAVYDDQKLDQEIRRIADKSLKGASKSLANAIPLIVNRDYRTQEAIR